MDLSPDERRRALGRLEDRGIVGSDARTCLDVVCRVAPSTVGYDRWVASLAGRLEPSLVAEYGRDAVRAVLALRR